MPHHSGLEVNRSLMTGASALMFLYAGPAWSQGMDSAVDSDVNGQPDTVRTQMEDIVVTAQRREENLQTVPIAITAVTANQLAIAGIRDTTDLSMAVPSLNFSRTAVYAQPYIRGVGTDAFAPGNEASVATYVDGVYIANMNAATFSFNNIERVEVLKGPQGTLYGRNSVGGLVSVVTRTPTQDFELKAHMGYGNFQAMEAGAYIAGGLAPNIAADFAVQFRDQGKGYNRNISPLAVNRLAGWAGAGSRVGFDEGLYLRSKVAIDLSDSVSLVLSGDYADFKNTLASNRQPGPGTDPVVPPGGTVSFEPRVNSLNVENSSNEDWGFSGTLRAELGGADFTSITAYRKTLGMHSQDSDDTSAPQAHTITITPYEQFSQELQLASASGSSFEWIAGLYYLWADAGYRAIESYSNNALLPLPGFNPPPSIFSGTRSLAGFAQASFDIGGNGRLTVGGRYTYDKKDFRSTFAGALAPQVNPPMRDSQTWKKPTWRIAYDHKIGDSMIYASYNRGYKSGVYNTALGFPPPVDPEVLDAFELGFKSDLFDRRLRINVAGFYSLYKDLQVRAQLPGNQGVVVQNAASARIKGIDGDIYAVLTDDLQLQVGFSWIHGRYKDFEFANVFLPRADAPGNLSTTVDASGNRLIRTPEFSGSIGLRYSHENDDLSRVYGNAHVFLSDTIYWEPANRVTTDSYVVVNGTIGYTLKGGVLSVEAWAKNLLDKTYNNNIATSANGDRVSYAPPRTYGVTARVSF